MPLNINWVPSTDEDFSSWTFAHADHHRSIVDALQAQFNQDFTLYILDPFDPERPEIWLMQHQAMHDEMNSALNLAQNDLTALDFEDNIAVQQWIADNYNEHFAADAALKIGG